MFEFNTLNILAFCLGKVVNESKFKFDNLRMVETTEKVSSKFFKCEKITFQYI